MEVGDLVMKVKGMRTGRTGIITRVYNKDNQGHIIYLVLSDGQLTQWSADWCETLWIENESR